LREGYSEKQTQEKVEEFNVKQTKQQNGNVIEHCQGIHIPANLAGQHTDSSFRRVTDGLSELKMFQLLGSTN
jgi:hypothetical protein